ncbi:MAG: TetR family transcriptional regulator [Alphaproteobacteria bacterium]|nr:TetR family transcriptional regulator [Alphaproteobacteria bacterium]
MTEAKGDRLKIFVHKEMRKSLLKCARRMVKRDGIAALSARKLAGEANSSVGMIYNIFGTMDNLIAEQNVMTLEELYEQMCKVSLGDNAFNNLNRYADILSAYIVANPNLWNLLYSRHLSSGAAKSSMAEARVIKKIDLLICWQAAGMIGDMSIREKRMMIKVLEMSLFALSGYLLGNKLQETSGLNRHNLCKLLMNTYVAGLNSLR